MDVKNVQLDMEVNRLAQGRHAMTQWTGCVFETDHLHGGIRTSAANSRYHANLTDCRTRHSTLIVVTFICV